MKDKEQIIEEMVNEIAECLEDWEVLLVAKTPEGLSALILTIVAGIDTIVPVLASRIKSKKEK